MYALLRKLNYKTGTIVVLNAPTEFHPNRNVAIDEDWSALRFAPVAQDPGRWA